MIDVSRVSGVTLLDGASSKTVTKIELGDKVLWADYKCLYVSIGDSIAAGHMITDSWANDYGGEGSQYGVNGNTSTFVIPNSYTDLIGKEIKRRYGNDVSVKSFARSGDTVADLLDKLRANGGNNPVANALKKANIVTVCIGANDVLQTAIGRLGDYINYGSPALGSTENPAAGTIAYDVQANLNILNNDANANSYKSLFDTLKSINPNAKYVFTTIYNPLKYLWLDESTEAQDYKDGFFGPLMWAIPDIGLGVDNAIRGALYNTSAVQTFFDRVNGSSGNGSDSLAAWTEAYVNKLNQILKSKISAYANPNFIVADTKPLFESFPDRPISAEVHYNDLVNVEFTRGYVIQDANWGEFWSNFSASDFLNSPNDIMSNVLTNIVNNVIMPDIDPHPETYGHYAMYRSFADALGWQNLNRYTVTYNANGGSGSMSAQEIVGIDGLAYTVLKSNTFGANTGYSFSGWKDQNGTSYSDGQSVHLTSDITLSAQWQIAYFTVKFTHSQGSVIQFDSGQTGPMECYALYIDGVEQPDLGAFSNSARNYSLPYGTSIGVIAQVSLGAGRSYVTFNGTKVNGNSSDARYGFTLTSDVTINFEWNQWQSTDLSDYAYDFGQVSYWNCYITTH